MREMHEEWPTFWTSQGSTFTGLPVTNPRFVRMEIDGSNPVLAFGTQSSTEAQLIFCTDPFCNTTQNTIVLARAPKVRPVLVPHNTEPDRENSLIATDRYDIVTFCYFHATMELATTKT